MTVSIRQSATDGLFKISDADGNHLILEAPIKNDTWQTTTFDAKLPFTLTAEGSMTKSPPLVAGGVGQNMNLVPLSHHLVSMVQSYHIGAAGIKTHGNKSWQPLHLS